MIELAIPASMTEQVEMVEDLDISYRTLHTNVEIHNTQNDEIINVPLSSLVSRYSDVLKEIIMDYELDDSEQQLYMFQPKRVSDELYGTTELWDTILTLNGAVSIVDFKPKVLRFYDPNKFKEYLNDILVIEDEASNNRYY